MDIKTQERYAKAMEKLIKEVYEKLDRDIVQYAYDEQISQAEAEDCIIEEFIISGENAGAMNSECSGVDLKDFHRWILSETFNIDCGDEYREFSK